MSAILVVEDSPETQALLRRTLSGMDRELVAELVMAGTVAEARRLLAEREFELILLDISLPDQDGLEYFGELRADERTRSVPVMFLTGQKDVAHKVTAFSMGAEDYVEKPFNPLELRARVEAKLRSSARRQEERNVVVRGPLRLDAATLRASLTEAGRGTRSIRLTPKEFALLFCLARNEERVMSRQQLLDAGWGDGSEVYDRIVDTHVSALRKKLGEHAGLIESVAGVGYRFTSAPARRRAA